MVGCPASTSRSQAWLSVQGKLMNPCSSAAGKTPRQRPGFPRVISHRSASEKPRSLAAAPAPALFPLSALAFLQA